MALKLMHITNNGEVARIAEDSGVDWIFIDLELNGKEERQGHLDTVISRHHIADVAKVRAAVTKAELLVRVNPIFEGSKAEIDRVIADGADIVMLPFFKTKEEVATFVDYVDKRAKVCLLWETPEAVEVIDDILAVPGIDYIHIGLNDLHLGYGKDFMFELLADGTVDALCEKISACGIPYGFGGIARLGNGDLPTEHVMAEHYRVGSTMAILSRSFCNVQKVQDLDEIQATFETGVNEIRAYEAKLAQEDEAFFAANHEWCKEKIMEIKENKILQKS